MRDVFGTLDATRHIQHCTVQYLLNGRSQDLGIVFPHVVHLDDSCLPRTDVCAESKYVCKEVLGAVGWWFVVDVDVICLHFAYRPRYIAYPAYHTQATRGKSCMSHQNFQKTVREITREIANGYWFSWFLETAAGHVPQDSSGQGVLAEFVNYEDSWHFIMFHCLQQSPSVSSACATVPGLLGTLGLRADQVSDSRQVLQCRNNRYPAIVNDILPNLNRLGMPCAGQSVSRCLLPRRRSRQHVAMTGWNRNRTITKWESGNVRCLNQK
jgi:hypothetical protein